VDELLARIGGVLRQNRGDGFAFRKGGDEFLVVLPRATRGAARAVRDRVEEATGVEVLGDGTPVFIAGGAAEWTSGKTFNSVVSVAARRMHERKQARKS
jgi:GGDEF domain-containing protein